MPRDIGHWKEAAEERIVIVGESQADEITAARERGDAICTTLYEGEPAKTIPDCTEKTVYAVFAEAKEDIHVCFVAHSPAEVADNVIRAVALGMMDNSNFVWR